jgi:hypothetical protein
MSTCDQQNFSLRFSGRLSIMSLLAVASYGKALLNTFSDVSCHMAHVIRTP